MRVLTGRCDVGRWETLRDVERGKVGSKVQNGRLLQTGGVSLFGGGVRGVFFLQGKSAVVGYIGEKWSGTGA